MRAQDVMTRNVVTVSPDTDVHTIARCLVERGISAVPVVDASGRAIGIVSEGDLMRRSESGTERHPSWWLRLFGSPEERARDYVKSHGRRAQNVMTREVITVSEETPLDEVATILERHRIKRVPVVRDGKVVGIVSRANLLHGLAVGAAASTVSASDGEIRAALDKALVEAGIRTDFLNVVISEGIAHLWGAVESPEEKRAARVAAEGTEGVTSVEDNIRVMPEIVRATLWAE